MRTDSSVIRALEELELLIDRINGLGIAGAGKIRYSQNARQAGLGRDLWRSSRPDAGVGDLLDKCSAHSEFGFVCGRISQSCLTSCP